MGAFSFQAVSQVCMGRAAEQNVEEGAVALQPSTFLQQGEVALTLLL